MRLTVVGCSGSYPGPDSPASCYLVEADAEGRTWRILLDFGSGSLGSLHHYVDPLAIEAVFFSHLHADHCLDLTGLYVLRKYHPSGAQPPIPVYGPVGVAGRMARAYDLPEDPGLGDDFDFREYDGTVTFGPFEITPVPMAHPVPAFGLRVVADGRTLAFTGDTGPTPALDELAAGADLLLSEAAFRDAEAADNPPALHLTGSQAADVALRAGVPRLVLTHIPAWYDRAEILSDATSVPGYAGEIVLAESGAVYEI